MASICRVNRRELSEPRESDNRQWRGKSLKSNPAPPNCWMIRVAFAFRRVPSRPKKTHAPLKFTKQHNVPHCCFAATNSNASWWTSVHPRFNETQTPSRGKTYQNVPPFLMPHAIQASEHCANREMFCLLFPKRPKSAAADTPQIVRRNNAPPRAFPHSTFPHKNQLNCQCALDLSQNVHNPSRMLQSSGKRHNHISELVYSSIQLVCLQLTDCLTWLFLAGM